MGERLAEQFAAHLEALAARDAFSGAVLLAYEDEPIFVRAYGQASREFGAPNREDTKFNLGSMNKMFTGVAIAQLAEAGRLSVGDAVGAHLPEYPRADVARTVTIHHLLTHTSGLGSYWNDRFEAARADLRSVDDSCGSSLRARCSSSRASVRSTAMPATSSWARSSSG